MYTDIPSGEVTLAAHGRYRVFGVCEIDVAVEPASKIYMDVSPRLSYAVAAAVGGIAGSVVGAAITPNVHGGIGAAIMTGATGIAAGSTVGAAGATVVEAPEEHCRGPYKLELLSEPDAMNLLPRLTWSGN